MSADENLTVRRLRQLLDKVPEEFLDCDIYASYDARCLTSLYEFDPLDFSVKWHDGKVFCVIPGD